MQVVILEHKSIICPGYSCILHIHNVVEEVTLLVWITFGLLAKFADEIVDIVKNTFLVLFYWYGMAWYGMAWGVCCMVWYGGCGMVVWCGSRFGRSGRDVM